MVQTPCAAVFGGSGKTGRELIAIALKKGVLVRALYRPGSEPSRTPGLESITGQSRDEPSARHSPMACIHGRVRRKRIPRQSLGPLPPPRPPLTESSYSRRTLEGADGAILMDNATRLPSLAGKVACGGMVNAYSSLRAASR